MRNTERRTYALIIAICGLLMSCMRHGEPQLSEAMQAAAKHQCEDAAKSLFDDSTRENLLADVKPIAASTSSYLLSGMGFAADGLMIVTTGTISFTVQCVVPTVVILSSLKGSVHFSEALCLGDTNYYHPQLGEDLWQKTSAWRDDPRIYQLNEAQLEIASCYGRRNDKQSLLTAYTQLESLQESPTWPVATSKQTQRAQQLHASLYQRMKREHPSLIASANERKADLKQQLHAQLLNLKTYRDAINNDEWAFVRLSVNPPSYIEACNELPVRAGTSRFHPPTRKQLQKAIERNVFEVHPLPDDIRTRVFDGQGRLVSYLEELPSAANGADLLCVR